MPMQQWLQPNLPAQSALLMGDNSNNQLWPMLAPNADAVSNASLAAATWTTLVLGTAGTRIWICGMAISTETNTQLYIRPTGRPGQYLNVFLAAGIPFVQHFPFGWNKGQLGDGLEIYSQVAASVHWMLNYYQSSENV